MMFIFVVSNEVSHLVKPGTCPQDEFESIWYWTNYNFDATWCLLLITSYVSTHACLFISPQMYSTDLHHTRWRDGPSTLLDYFIACMFLDEHVGFLWKMGDNILIKGGERKEK